MWVDISHKPRASQLAHDLDIGIMCALCHGRYRSVHVIVLDREPIFITQRWYILKHWQANLRVYIQFIIVYVFLEVRTLPRVISCYSSNGKSGQYGAAWREEVEHFGKWDWCPVQVNTCKSKLQGAGSLARPTLDVNKVKRLFASTVICNA